MRRPQDADRVVELTYGVSMVVYMVIAVCGYLMYGRNVSDEVSCPNYSQSIGENSGATLSIGTSTSQLAGVYARWLVKTQSGSVGMVWLTGDRSAKTSLKHLASRPC